MYRITGFESLESTGFFDYRDGVFAIEWAENISEFLPENAIKVEFEYIDINLRRITFDTVS
jgi:tRNA A37 threonylcarbamoyladenosine biosynthesis protein TsaE